MVHIKLRKGQELVVIGDVHGCEDHFDLMLKRAKVGTKRILVSIGDVYPHSRDADPALVSVSENIIYKIKKLYSAGWAYMVRGNCEQIRLLDMPRPGPSGLEFCSYMPTVLSFQFSNQNVVTVVHGGFSNTHSWKGLSENSEPVYIRNLSADGEPALDDTDSKTWHEMYDGRFGYVISSHGSADNKITQYNHSCSIDTKCYKTGVLSGQIVSDGTLKELILVNK